MSQNPPKDLTENNEPDEGVIEPGSFIDLLGKEASECYKKGLTKPLDLNDPFWVDETFE